MQQPKWTIGGVPVVEAEWVPPNEILIVVPEQRVEVIHKDGRREQVVVRKAQFGRILNIESDR